ncbi:MAG TPA: tyrosine-type recombinase/integrase [Bryobacteraceae bacterium]|jgi:hypothetical protein
MNLFDVHGRRKYLTPEERQAFLNAADNAADEVRTFCGTLGYAGCRISEALALTGTRVDRVAGVLVIESLKKRRKGIYRAVPVPRVLLDALHDVHNLGEVGGGRLWNWSRTTAWRRVREVMDAASISGAYATPKGVRHGFGIKAVTSDVPLNMTQKWLGHARITTTAIYTNAVGPEEQKIAERMWGHAQAWSRANNSGEIVQHLNQGLLHPTEMTWGTEEGRFLPLSELQAQPTAAQPGYDPVALFVGPKYETYYQTKWARMHSRASQLSWNWAGFFGIYWLVYRKMYSYAIVFGALVLASLVATLAGLDSLSQSLFFVEAGFSAVPLFLGNSIYEHFVQKKVRRILAQGSRENTPQLVKSGGTNAAAAIVFMLVFFIFGLAATFANNWKAYFGIHPQQIEGPGVTEVNPKTTPTSPPEAARETPHSSDRFDPDLNATWVDDPQLVEKYGPYISDTLSKFPTMLDPVRQMDPAFEANDVGTVSPPKVLRLRDGRVLFIAEGCRAHACPDYRLMIVIDKQSAEMFFYENGEGDGGVAGAAARIERQLKGEQVNSDAWERFSGREDPVIRALLRKL